MTEERDDRYRDRLGPVGGGEDIYTGVLSRLLAGPAAFGLLGAGVDRWLDTGFALPVGLILGMATALYVIWLRYGMAGNADPGAPRDDHGIEESQ